VRGELAERRLDQAARDGAEMAPLFSEMGSRGRAQAGFQVIPTSEIELSITAAAYLVVSIVGRTWTIDECGDRDPSAFLLTILLATIFAGLSYPAYQRLLGSLGGWP